MDSRYPYHLVRQGVINIKTLSPLLPYQLENALALGTNLLNGAAIFTILEMDDLEEIASIVASMILCIMWAKQDMPLSSGAWLTAAKILLPLSDVMYVG